MDATTLLNDTIARLRTHEGQYAEISRRSGMSYSSLVKLAQGHAENPTVSRLQELILALDAFEGIPPRVATQPAPAAEPDPDAGRIEPFSDVP